MSAFIVQKATDNIKGILDKYSQHARGSCCRMKADMPFLNGVYSLGGISDKQLTKAPSVIGCIL